jgi:hypothetical protein
VRTSGEVGVVRCGGKVSHGGAETTLCGGEANLDGAETIMLWRQSLMWQSSDSP